MPSADGNSSKHRIYLDQLQLNCTLTGYHQQIYVLLWPPSESGSVRVQAISHAITCLWPEATTCALESSRRILKNKGCYQHNLMLLAAVGEFKPWKFSYPIFGFRPPIQEARRRKRVQQSWQSDLSHKAQQGLHKKWLETGKPFRSQTLPYEWIYSSTRGLRIRSKSKQLVHQSTE